MYKIIERLVTTTFRLTMTVGLFLREQGLNGRQFARNDESDLRESPPPVHGSFMDHRIGHRLNVKQFMVQQLLGGNTNDR